MLGFQSHSSGQQPLHLKVVGAGTGEGSQNPSNFLNVFVAIVINSHLIFHLPLRYQHQLHPPCLLFQLMPGHPLPSPIASFPVAVSPPTRHKSKLEAPPESADSSGTDNVSAESTAIRGPNGDVSRLCNILMMQTLLNSRLRMKNQW